MKVGIRMIGRGHEKCEELNMEAVFSDETRSFRYPEEPTWRDKVTVILRTLENNAEEAFIVWDEGRIKMKLSESDGVFDYYRGSFSAVG